MKTTIIKKDNFTTVHNNLIMDETISWKAKGILLYMLSRPDDWKFNIKEISKNAKDGTDSVKYGLQELVKAGYISRKRNSDGTLDYYIFEDKNENNVKDFMEKVDENPQEENPQVENPQVENPQEENPQEENPQEENPLYTKERILLKKEYNKKDNNNIYSSIINFLNNRTNRTGKEQYKITDNTRKIIKTRMKEGYVEEDFYTVIENMCNAWIGTEFEPYLRPKTLFSNKFEDYLAWKSRNKNLKNNEDLYI